MKKVFILVWFTIITCVFSCTNSKNYKGLPYDYLGNDTTNILKVTNPEQLALDIKANDLLNKTGNPILSFISTSEILSNWKSQHPFYFSTKDDGENTSIVFTKIKDTLSFKADSIPKAIIENFSIKERLAQKIVLNKDSLFMTEKDSVTIFSTSRQSLISIVEQKENHIDQDLTKLLEFSKDGEIVSTGITSLYAHNVSEVKNMKRSQEMHILPDGIQVSGIIKSKDSSLIDVFKGQTPQASKVAAIVPSDFNTVKGFTFSDAGLLINSLKRYKKDTTITAVHPLLETITEIAEVHLSKDRTLIMSSIDMPQSLASIDIDIKEFETFRDITIYENNISSLLVASFEPLLSGSDYPYLIMLDSYLVCTSSLEAAKNSISTFQNKNVLEQTSYFSLINTEMLSTSSLYYLGQEEAVSKITNAVLNTAILEKQKSIYPFAALQYSYDNSFAHLNFVTKEVSKRKQVVGTVSQKFSLTTEQTILGSPQFFTNHRTGGKDVIFQDITNTLFLYSSAGKKLWSKKIDGAIIGDINEIDLLRNGKKQLTFTTQSTFYVLDRNGKEVAPFPLEFKDKITQPLAVFDYDNNRKYRFIITQGKNILMYDGKGKKVKGFTFKKTESPLVFAPKHIRSGTKDYIILAEENGKTTFLSRTGKERIKVKETFNFGEIPIQKEGANFVVITADKKKHLITSSGGTSTQNLNVSGSYYYNNLGKTRVTLDDNLLRINDVLVELPFGIYSEPQLINHNRNTYVAVTDMQEHKVYVYDKNRKLLEGFPVFGTSAPKLGTNSTKLLIVTLGSDKDVLCYQVN